MEPHQAHLKASLSQIFETEQTVLQILYKKSATLYGLLRIALKYKVAWECLKNMFLN